MGKMILATAAMKACARKAGYRTGSNAGHAWVWRNGYYTPGEFRHFQDEMLEELWIRAAIPRAHRKRKYVQQLMAIAERSFHQRMATRLVRLTERWGSNG